MKVHNLKSKQVPCGLHLCLRHAMRLSRWIGYCPIQGLDQVTADGTRFRIKAFYSIYYLSTIISQMVMWSFCLFWFLETAISLPTISNLVFYTTGLISAILLFRLSWNWQKLIKKAKATEKSLRLLKLDNSAVNKCSTVAYVIMSLAVVEHLLCTSFNVKFVMQCLHETGISDIVLKNSVIFRMPYLFSYLPYNLFYAALAGFVCFQATFIWSFTDILIICFSIYITSYFNSLNRVIRSKINNNAISWGQLREDYSKLVILVKEIDAHLSAFILLSFFTDLFFICLQLFNTLHRNYASFQDCGASETRSVLSSPDYLLYYLYSVLFLILRTLSLCLFSAGVHEASKKPVVSMYDVPSSEYDDEVQRFQTQLRFTKIALSGKFFYVTRHMVLQVLGTIVTYELVLLQFSVTPDQYTLSGVIKDNDTGIFDRFIQIILYIL